MKLIKSSVEIVPQAPELEGLYKHIEKAGRVCYKSEDRITEDSYVRFIEMLKKNAHTGVLEHGTVYLILNNAMGGNPYIIANKYKENKYSIVKELVDNNDISNRGIPFTSYYITTNYRVIIENGWEDDLQYMCEPTECHGKRITVKFVCDKAIMGEFVRHRVFSFAGESTRYCAYSSGKFGSEVTFIKPSWSFTKTANYKGVDNFIGDYFEHSLREAEFYYLKLLELGWTPQQARAVLPNALKTELVMTGFLSDWEHFFELRCAKNAHPDAQVLANELKNKFIEKGWIKKID